jgi:hypothetical protein
MPLQALPALSERFLKRIDPFQKSIENQLVEGWNNREIEQRLTVQGITTSYTLFVRI